MVMLKKCLWGCDENLLFLSIAGNWLGKNQILRILYVDNEIGGGQ